MATFNHFMNSDMSTKAGYLFLLTDAGENLWQKLWFDLRRYVLTAPRITR